MWDAIDSLVKQNKKLKTLTNVISIYIYVYLTKIFLFKVN